MSSHGVDVEKFQRMKQIQSTRGDRPLSSVASMSESLKVEVNRKVVEKGTYSLSLPFLLLAGEWFLLFGDLHLLSRQAQVGAQIDCEGVDAQEEECAYLSFFCH